MERQMQSQGLRPRTPGIDRLKAAGKVERYSSHAAEEEQTVMELTRSRVTRRAVRYWG